MRPPKYPLEPLANLRRSEADAAAGRLGAARRAREGAERARRGLEERARSEADAAERVRREEGGKLARGELTAGDLAVTAAWGAGEAIQREALEASLREARSAEEEARQREARAVGDVAAREASARVVQGDRERWREGQRKRAEAREEEALSEGGRRRR